MWQRMGHKVTYFAFYGLQGGSIVHDGVRVLPAGYSQWGDDIVWPHAQACGADLLITNVDVFVLKNYGQGPIPWLPITPVMEDPLQGGIKSALNGAIEVAAISKYSQRVLREGGVRSQYLPLPVPTETFQPTNKAMAKASLGIPQDAYLIGHVGMNRGYRKGHDILLQAFQMFLAEVPNAYLWLHTDLHQSDGIDLESLIYNLGLQNNVRSPVRYDTYMGKPLPWMVNFYNALDLYVQPSRNEGQGMPVYEAAAVGNIIVAADTTSLSEIMEHAEGIAVPRDSKSWMVGNGWSYSISAEKLAQAMLDAHRKWGHGYVSMQNRQYAIETVSTPVIGHKWQDLLLNVEKRIRFAPTLKPWTTRPKVVQVSTDVINCGIGAYTRALMASLGEATDQQLVEVRSLENSEQIPPCDIVHWHFGAGISPRRDALEDIFAEIRQRGIQLVITFHDVDYKMINWLLERQMMNEAIVHWPLPGMEVSDARVHVLGGMGCPTYHPARPEDRAATREKFGFDPNNIIISTFGFASVGRGHFEIPMEMAPTLKANPNLHLQLIVPGNFLNEAGKNIVHDQLQRIIQAYELENQIHVVGDFLLDHEVLDRLWMSDLGYLYMGMDTASSSSAIRFFISARLPTVITPSTHFGDVRMGVVRLNSFSVTEFYLALMQTVQDYALRNRLAHEMNAVYQQWQWPRFAERMMGIYRKAQAA
jgi:glycosyltransferase involved in cell wall biosynthesis